MQFRALNLWIESVDNTHVIFNLIVKFLLRNLIVFFPWKWNCFASCIIHVQTGIIAICFVMAAA